MAHVGADVPLDLRPSGSDLDELQKRVRENLSGWGRRLELARKSGEEPTLGEYIPDQQGCYEVTTNNGGTLACGPEAYSGKWGSVRLGCAKTKGKFRAVTMQSAEVKRVLAPVHNALYDHITSFGWCVRGDVTKGDFEVVAGDLRKGEYYISGDYTAATDNIYLEAVAVIVGEISRCPELSERERSVLLGSFENLQYKTSSCLVGEHYPIKRGSMMGNLISFPILCLLNKSCWDIACDIRERGDRTRKGRFNGDDCMFCGDDAFFQTWSKVTSKYGFLVNEEKTGRSRRWLDLNSQTYDVRGHLMVAKATLGFLRPNRKEPGDMLAEVVRSLVGFSERNKLEVVIMLRHEIALRGVLSSVLSLSGWLRKQLIRKRWFRDSAMLGGAPTLERGIRRSVEVIVDRPPRQRFYGIVSAASARLQQELTNEWIGRRVRPLTVMLDRQAYAKARRSTPPNSLRRRFELRGKSWAFVWPKVLFECWKHLPIFERCGTRTWLGEHPFLTIRPRIVELRRPNLRHYPPPVALLEGADNLPRLI